MAAPITTRIPADYECDEWELVHDDGFVYKRKKRRLDPTALARAPDPAPDPAAEMKEKRERKRKALLNLKEKYQKEIGRWERLSNTLKAMEERAKSQVKLKDGAERDGEKQLKDGDEGLESVVSMENQTGSLFNEVFLQVEAQEAIIRDFSHLCDVAESSCSAQEEMAKQCFLDLPIWNSPCELMASLCEI